MIIVDTGPLSTATTLAVTAPMQAFDKFLGPLAPHRQAARTAPRTRHVLVMDATSEQGRSVCESLIKDNRWVVWGLVEDKEDVIAKGGSNAGYPTKCADECLALLAMQVKLIVGSLSMPASYESHLKDKDGIFLHVDCECIAPSCLVTIMLNTP